MRFLIQSDKTVVSLDNEILKDCIRKNSNNKIHSFSEISLADLQEASVDRKNSELSECIVNLNDKSVALFQTHGGWKGSCLDDMKKLCDGATICSTFDVQFDSYGCNKLITDEHDISNWIDSLI